MRVTSWDFGNGVGQTLTQGPQPPLIYLQPFDYSVRTKFFGPYTHESGIMLDQKKGENQPMTTASARHILVDTEEECLQLKDRIDSGEDFADVARAHSNCPSKAQGGDLGQFGPGMMVKEFDAVVFSADINTVQGPVKTQFGYHLLEVTGRD